MEQLLKYNHINKSKSNGVVWYYTIGKDKQLFCLEYVSGKYYHKPIGGHFSKICDINDWSVLNDVHLKNNQTHYEKSVLLKNYITERIGQSTFQTTFEVGWDVPGLFKLIIQYDNSNSISLTHKSNPPKKLSVKQTQQFIEKNKETIIKAQYKIKMQKQSKNSNKTSEKTPQIQETQNRETKRNTLDSTARVGRETKGKLLFIERSLKERYETQACKPFVKKYEWDD